MSILRGPTGLFLTLMIYWGLLQALRLPAVARGTMNTSLKLALAAAFGWFAIRFVDFLADVMEQHAVAQAEGDGDDVKVRGLRTQVMVMRRVGSILISVLVVSLMLLQFEAVRTVGMSLLASAGVLGIVLGVAAQRSIGTFIAGVQVSITQPVRVGDTVVIQNEWGTIEEVTLTYAVLRVWDQRRLVIPTHKLLDEAIENWTKGSPEIFGTIYIYADYHLPVEDLRQEVERILPDEPEYDGRAHNVRVTGATDRTIEIRVMMSARNGLAIWLLRCSVRERLIEWLQRYEGGKYLPRTRVAMERLPEGSPTGDYSGL
jgi:small-conductance mechanosensitive channel